LSPAGGDDVGSGLHRGDLLVLRDEVDVATPLAGLCLADRYDDLVAVLLALALDLGLPVVTAKYGALETHCQEFSACGT